MTAPHAELREALTTAMAGAWNSKAIVCEHSQIVPFGALADAALAVLQERGVPLDQPDVLDGFADWLDGYRVDPYVDGDGDLGVALRCQREDCGVDHAADVGPGPVPLDTLLDLAARDDAGYEPDSCHLIEVPGGGAMLVHAPGPVPAPAAAALVDVAKAVQRQATEALKAQGRAELCDTLLALRAQWDARRRKHDIRIETSDGITVVAETTQRTLARVLRELDEVLEGLGVGRG